MKKILTLIIVLISFLGLSQIQIGAGTSNKYGYPFYGLYDYSKTMFIYTQSEVGVSTSITELEFELGGYTTPYTFNGQYLQLAHTTDAEFGTNVAVDLTNVNYSNLTTVKSNFNVVITTNGWMKITFDTPFSYNGVDNLLVIWENWDGSWASNYGYAESVFDNCSCANDYMSWYKYTDGAFPTGVGTRDQSYRPNIKLTSVSALPIELLYFKGDNISTYNKLYWETYSERNNDYFTLEKTKDGTYFYNVAIINGIGNSNTKLYYEINDYNIDNIINYYRLKQTDYDGKFKYFDIISIDNRNNSIPKLLKVTNILGQEVSPLSDGLLIYYYSDGSSVIKSLVKGL